MNKEILVETIKSKFEVLKDKPANVLKRIKMVLSDWDFNRNGRVYPKELWENVVDSDYVKEMINSHGLVGELDHPEDRLEISLQNVSHVINDMWIDGDKLMGVIDILPTPNGKIVNELLDYGTEIGISSRGAGSVGANNIVDPDYQFVTFDFVARPSCEAARYKAILEGVKLDIDTNSDDKVNAILEGYKNNLKENDTTTSFIDIKEIVGYAEEYLSTLLNSSVGIVKRDDGQYTITMRNDDKTIDKWLKLHNKNSLNEGHSQEDIFKNYYNKSALPAPGEEELYGYDLSDVCDNVEKYFGLKNKREALNKIVEEHLDKKVIDEVMKYSNLKENDTEGLDMALDESKNANSSVYWQRILDKILVARSNLSVEEYKGLINKLFNFCKDSLREFKKDRMNEAAMSDQEVYKTVLEWYKEQIEAGKMTLNQCYELLSDKAKVSLNKMVDQSKIKESIMNDTIKKLINESIELNNQETLSKEQYRDKVLETIDKMVKISELYEKLAMIENSVKSKNHEKWRSIPLRSNMTGHYRYWVSDSLTRDESKYFKKEKYNDDLNQGEAYIEKNNNILTRKMNDCYFSLDKFIKNADKFLDNLLKAGVDGKVYKSIKKILEYNDHVYDDEDMKIQIENIYKIERLLKKSL